MIKPLAFLLMLCCAATASDLQPSAQQRMRLTDKPRPHYKDPEKMQQLYDRYPQLTSKQTNACVRNFNAMLMNLTYFPYDLMTAYGTHSINDIGNYDECKMMPDADYVLININISHTPIAFWFGACLPHECVQSDYQAVTNTMTDTINAVYQSIFGNSTIDTGVFRAETKLTMAFRKPDEIQQDWQEGSLPGYITFLALVVPLLLLISCIPSVYHIVKRRYDPVAIESRRLRNAAIPIRASMDSALGPEGQINQTQLAATLSRAGQSAELTRDATGRLVSGMADSHSYLP